MPGGPGLVALERQAGGHLGADEDLARRRGVLHLGRAGGGRARDDQLVVQRPDPEQLHGAAVEAHGHPQLHPADRQRLLDRRAQRGPHLHRGGGGLLRVIVADEQQQQGVPTELEQRAASLEGDVEHRPEHPVQDVGELLDADATAHRQAFGERREAGDVDEAEASVELLPAHPRCVEVPLGRDPRHEPIEGVRRSGWHDLRRLRAAPGVPTHLVESLGCPGAPRAAQRSPHRRPTRDPPRRHRHHGLPPRRGQPTSTRCTRRPIWCS